MQSSLNSNISLARRLKTARQKADLDQKGLAKELGTDQSTISRIEKGQKPRKKLELAINNFITKQNAKGQTKTDKILDQLQNSSEFRSLIGRIVDNL